MIRRTPFLLVALLAPGLALAQNLGDKIEYGECLRLAEATPGPILARAEAWVRAGGGLPAEHCAAVALLYSGQNERAATRLDTLAVRASSFSPRLRSELSAQAGNAWLAVGNAERALASQNLAVNLDPQNAENWIDRSITLAGLGAYKEAAEDLSTALKLAPRRPDILLLRAVAYRATGDLKRARTDADAALVYDKDNPEALIQRGHIRLASGDKKGADADYRRALLFTPPDSALAKQAQAGLAQQTATPPAPQRPAPRPQQR
jgi:tetratricopeptide (TPR) repeat protein